MTWTAILEIVSNVLGIATSRFIIRTLKRLKSRLFCRINTGLILNLEKHGLIIENRDVLYDTRYIAQHPFVFWPAVPTRDANIIHAVFIKYARTLSDAGLRVVLFVLDEYYCVLEGLGRERAIDDSRGFVNTLLEYGLKVEVIYEHSVLQNTQAASLFGKHLVRYAGLLKLGDLHTIGSEKHYLNNNTSFLRFIKPVLNMLYLKASNRKYGFTLSGLDEHSLWEHYVMRIDDAKHYKLANFYIPVMLSIESRGTDAMDRVKNITFSDRSIDIASKIKVTLESDSPSPTSGFLYALEYLRFMHGEHVTIRLPNGDARMYTNQRELLQDIQRGNLGSRDHVAAELSQVLHEILHPNQSGIESAVTPRPIAEHT